MSVLKKITAQDIKAVKEAAKAAYLGRIEGTDIDWEKGQNNHGHFQRKFYRGGIVSFIVAGNVDVMIDDVIAKIDKGYKRVSIPSEASPLACTYYMQKPDAEIEKDLVLEYEGAEAALRVAVQKENDEIVATQVALRKATVLRQREEEARKADQQLEADLEAEVRAALGAK
jgi:predicted small secreted protein